tara:strand:- start:862 stop:1359 length:498 start_codon:yes stop_codon:yes gene_type:complete
MDPITALAGATAAFNAIKKGFQMGRDIEGMSSDLGRWMGSMSDIKKAEEQSKKPPLFKKLFAAGSVEEEALNSFMAKKKAEDMREELRNIITFSRGQKAWDELIRTEVNIRKKRQEMIYAQQERQQFWIDMSLVTVAGLVLVGLMVLGVWAIGYEKGMWGPLIKF